MIKTSDLIEIVNLTREKRGMPVYELADKISVNRATIDRFLNGQSAVGSDTLQKLIDVLGIQLFSE